MKHAILKTTVYIDDVTIKSRDVNGNYKYELLMREYDEDTEVTGKLIIKATTTNGYPTGGDWCGLYCEYAVIKYYYTKNNSIVVIDAEKL